MLYRAEGITTHPIIASLFSMLCCFLCVMLYMKNNNKKYILISVFLFISALLTQSRNVYLCLLVVIVSVMLLWAILYSRKIVPINCHVFLAVMVMSVLLIWQFGDSTSVVNLHIVSRFSGIEDTGSYLQRAGSLDFLKSSLSNLADIHVWIGHGIGSLRLYLQSHNIFFVTEGFFIVDNQYVTSIYDIGLIGVMVCAAGLLYLVVRRFRYASAARNDADTVRVRLVPICMLVYFLAAVFFFDFYANILCQMLLGFIVAQLSSGRQGSAQQR